MKTSYWGRILGLSLLLAVVSCSWVLAIEPRGGHCTGDKVNVRGGHGENFKNFPVLYQLNKGNQVRILDQDNGWFKISSDLAPQGTGVEQWVLEKFIQEDKKTEKTTEKATEKISDNSVKIINSTYFWAEMNETDTLINIISPIDGMDMEKMLEKNPPSGEGLYKPIKANDPLLPKKFKIGDSFAIITEKGVVQRDLKGFGIGPGAGEIHFYLILDGNPGSVGSFGLVLPNLVSNPDVLRKPVEVAVPEAEQKSFYGKIQAGLMNIATAEQRKVIQKNPLNEKSCRVFNPKTPLGEGRLIAVHIPMGDTEQFSALLFVKTDGELILSMKDVTLLERYDPLYFVDADMDGFDEIVFESSYYEGSYTHLIRWEGNKPIDETLTGDGA